MKRLGGKLLRALGGLLILLGAWVGLFSICAGGHQYPLVAAAGEAPKRLKGAYHVHSTRSDGRADPEAIADAAKRAGLAFVVMTDHNAAPRAPWWSHGVLMIEAVELSTAHGHLVALGLTRALTAEELAGDPIAAVRAQGATPVLAHPVQRKNPWRDWDAGVHAAGLELYSADTMWRQTVGSPPALACAAGSYLANPPHALMTMVQAQPETAARLRSLDAPALALCAHDAHGLPPYEPVFRALAMVLPGPGTSLPPAADDAAAYVLGVLAAGHAWCSFEALGNGAGFAIEGLAADRRATVGERLRVQLPSHGEAKVRVTATGGAEVDPDGVTVRLTAPGPAHLQVELLAPGCTTGEEWRPWLVPSPFLVVAPP